MAYWRLTVTDRGREIEFPIYEDLVFTRQQWTYFQADNARELLHCGRGWGKDHLPLLKKAIRGHRRYFEGLENRQRAGPKYHLAVLAGQEKNYLECRGKLMDFIPRFPGWGRDNRRNYRWSQDDQRWYLFGDNEIWISLFSLYASQHNKGGSGLFRGPGFDDALVTEAQLCKQSVIESDVFPMVFRGGYDGRITLCGTSDNGWFDEACSQALEGRGYYGNWALTTGTSFENPLMSEDVARQTLREYEKNPYLFRRERLGDLNVSVPSDMSADCPIHEGLLASAYTQKRVVLSGQALAVFDLAYGGKDKIVRGIWDRATRALVRIDVWTSEQLKIETSNPYPSIVAIFERTAREFPGCEICYDATGQAGPYVYMHVPGWVRCKPITRNNAVKRKHFEDLLDRLSATDDKGRSRGIVLPDPDKYPFSDATQRANMKTACAELTSIRRVTERSKTGATIVRYIKGEGYEDHCADMITLACSVLPGIARAPIIADPGKMVRALYL